MPLLRRASALPLALALLLLTLLLTPGCGLVFLPHVMMLEYDRVTSEKHDQPVYVLDAETNQPIPHATVTASYHHGGLGPPWRTYATTDKHGLAQLPAYLGESSATATADGYIQASSADSTLTFTTCAPSSTQPASRPSPLTLHLYRQSPRPPVPGDPASSYLTATLGLTVPDHFQGVLEYSTHSAAPGSDPRLASPPPKDRVYWADYLPPANPPTLGDGYTLPPRALGGGNRLDAGAYRYQSGTEIPIGDPNHPPTAPNTVRAWPLGSHGDEWERTYHITQVGTFSEARATAEKLRDLPDSYLNPPWPKLIGLAGADRRLQALKSNPALLYKKTYIKPAPLFSLPATTQPQP